MRISIVVTAGLVTAGAGWFWLAPDDVATRAAPPPRARTADLTNLRAQLADAVGRAGEVEPVRDADLTAVAARVAATDGLTDGLADERTDVLAFDTIEDGRFDELLALPPDERDAAFAEALGRQLTIDDRLLLGIEDDADAAEPDVLADADVVGHEIVHIRDFAPIIDTSSISGCGGVQVDHIVTPIPPSTFDAVLGDAAGTHREDGAVTFAGGTRLENVYVVEETD